MAWRRVNFPAGSKCGEPLGEPVRPRGSQAALFAEKSLLQISQSVFFTPHSEA